MENAITYEHFKPSLKENEGFSKFVDVVAELAPSDSQMGVLIDKLADKTFKTAINVSATCGKFTVEAFGSTARASLAAARKSILVMLEEWKKIRFRSPNHKFKSAR